MIRLKKLHIGTLVAVGGNGVLVKFDDEGYAVDDEGNRSETFYSEEVLSPLSRFLDQRTVPTEITTTETPTTTESTTTEATTTESTTEAPTTTEATTEAPTTTVEPTTTAAPKKKKTTTTQKE